MLGLLASVGLAAQGCPVAEGEVWNPVTDTGWVAGPGHQPHPLLPSSHQALLALRILCNGEAEGAIQPRGKGTDFPLRRPLRPRAEKLAGVAPGGASGTQPRAAKVKGKGGLAWHPGLCSRLAEAPGPFRVVLLWWRERLAQGGHAGPK